MKKFASLFLALALCMGLAVPAFAAEYGSVSVDTGYGVVTFDAAIKGEATTVKFADPDTGELTDQMYVPIMLKPGSNLKVDAEYGVTYRLYEVDAEGVLHVTGAVDDFYTGGIEDSGFIPENSDYARVVGGADGTVYWVKLGDGTATEPTTPVEPEQPTEPEKPTEPTTPVEPEKPAEPATPDKPGTYTVKKGDTWSTICTNFYGDNAQRYKLMKANKNVKLAAGAVITLPEKLGNDTLIPAAVANEGETLYTVQYGDTLGAIAKAHYGNVMQYKAIYERNADRLVNANTIYEGQVIVLPAK